MSTEFPVFVFVGSAERRAHLETIAATRDWSIFEAAHDPMFGTLAQVISFFPDAVIIEDTPALSAVAHEVYRHITSVDYEPILILSDSPNTWQIAGGARAMVLPTDTSRYEIADAVRALLADAEPIFG